MLAIRYFHSFDVLNFFVVRNFHDSDFEESVPSGIRNFSLEDLYSGYKRNC